MSRFRAGRGIAAIFVAKGIRTFCYGYLGILLPLYLASLGLSFGMTRVPSRAGDMRD